MKKCIAIVAVAVALAGGRAHAEYVNMAGQIHGTNSFSAAAYCGLNAHGNYTTAVGNNALRESSQDNGVAVGAMTLASAKDGDMNTMVGAYAGFGSTNLVGCVGIGAGAFMGANDMTNATSVNGQFVARGDLKRFWITADKSSTADWDGCPPIYYDDGVLYLNARTIVKREGVVERKAPLHTSNWATSAEPALYVARYGRDANDGKSMYYPKKTLQAALLALEDDDTTIYVGEGVYESPQYLNRDITTTEHVVHIVGVGKPEDVVIDCGGTRRISAGNNGRIGVYENLTFKNVGTPSTGQGSNQRGAFQLFYLYNCRVVGTITVRNSYWPFTAGYIDGCTVDATVATDGTAATFPLDYGTIFSDVNCFDSVFKLAHGSGIAPNLAYGLYAENCYMEFEKLYDYRIRSVHALNVPHGGLIDCTFVVKEGTYASSAANSSGNCTNLVYAVNTTPPTFTKASYVTGAADLLSRLDPETLRPAPIDYEVFPFGYASAADRAARDGAALSVMAVLEASGALSQPQAAALQATRPKLVARNAKSVVARPRNAEIELDATRGE